MMVIQHSILQSLLKKRESKRELHQHILSQNSQILGIHQVIAIHEILFPKEECENN